MRILVTNDDGIDSTGLHVLARALVPLGDVVVVAPDREYSGFGAALGTLHTMQPEVHEERIEGVPEAWAVTAAPAMCVFFARLGVFGDVDLVVSGINPGINVGRALYHSGTVGAALTARNGFMHGLAISQAVTGHGVEGQGWDEMLVGQHWETAASVAAEAASGLLASPPSQPVVVNINVPNCESHEISGWRHADIGTIPPRTVARARLLPKEGHHGAHHVEMDWGDARDLPSETDGGTVEEGMVAVSYISAFVHEPNVELESMEEALTTFLE
ncbi:MAG: 5'/3'-nucleotidase SurE [Acidimicrobiales bacterium]|nr:5'/3'-nucleotidase SurE [Acidimicrobiales bacterium]